MKERFRGRRASFMRKARELSDKCDARVYVVICRNGKYYTFNSTAESWWPPTENQIVGQQPGPKIRLLRII
jgi:SRF-type transcription factor (DNA-binding and dimerisation domain)